MMKRGSYFFILDAFVGATILFITLITLNNAQVVEPIIQTTSFTSNDYLALLTNTELRDFHNVYVNELRAGEIITDSRITIMEAVIDLHFGTEPNNATLLLGNFTPNLIPAQSGLQVFIGGNLVYGLREASLPDANSVSTSRTLVINSDSLETHEVEVKVWI